MGSVIPRDFAFQCNHCRNLDLMSRLRCVACREPLAVEAIDQYVYSTHEVRLDRIATLAANLAVGAALCRAWETGVGAVTRWGEVDAETSWMPGCGRSAP